MLNLFLPKLSTVDQIKIVKCKLERILKSNSSISRIILVGSAVHFQMGENSDVDLVIIHPDDCDQKQIRSDLAKNRGQDMWPEDLLIVSESFFLKRSKLGGIYWIAATEGVEIFPRFDLRS